LSKWIDMTQFLSTYHIYDTHTFYKVVYRIPPTTPTEQYIYPI
jgi:hypothetical protein